MKRWFVLAAVGIAGCGVLAWGPARARENVSERPALGHPWELQRTSATVSAQQCPKPTAPGPRAAAQASRALFKALPKLYPTLDRNGATVQGLVSLGGGLPSSLHVKRYQTGAAKKACGSTTIGSSWVAWVLLPNNQASAANHVVYLVNTKKGWRAWYEWNPQNPEGTVVDVG